MKLSIIIPVYHTGKTLGRCMDSILSQSFKDYEILLVDDGSGNPCDQLCDDYGRKETRIRVIHQAHGGLSHARNTGIKLATGKYVTFVDSDDRIETGTLDRLMSILAVHPEYDILEYRAFVHYSNPNRQHVLRLGDHVYHSMYDYWLTGKVYAHSYVCNKVFRRTLFQGQSFPEGKSFEDMGILPALLERCKTVATTSAGLYYYYDNPQGITRMADGKQLGDLLQFHLQALAQLPPKDSVLYRQYYASVLNIQMDVYERTGQEPKLPKMPFPSYALYPLYNFKLTLLNIFGTKWMCKWNRRIHSVYRRNR